MTLPISGVAAPDLQSLLQTYSGISVETNGGRGLPPISICAACRRSRRSCWSMGCARLRQRVDRPRFANIPLTSIERIEIARGAHSSQYGADAIGGVINIITKQGGACGERAWCGSVSTGVSHPWGGYASGSLQGRSSDGIDYAVGAAFTGTQGYDFTTPEAFGHEPDDDGFLQGSFNLRCRKISTGAKSMRMASSAVGATSMMRPHPHPTKRIVRPLPARSAHGSTIRPTGPRRWNSAPGSTIAGISARGSKVRTGSRPGVTGCSPRPKKLRYRQGLACCDWRR